MEVLILKIVRGLKFGQFGSVDCRWLTDEGSRGNVKAHKRERSFLFVAAKRPTLCVTAERSTLCVTAKRSFSYVAAERTFSWVAVRRPTERFVDMEVPRMKDLSCKGSLAEGEAH